MSNSSQISYKGFIDKIFDGCILGWIYANHLPSSYVFADIIVDEFKLCTVVAKKFRADLKSANIGDGHHGFEVKIPSFLRDEKVHTISMRVCGLSEEIFATSTRLKFPNKGHLEKSTMHLIPA
jgi:hypothetical protein